MSGNDTRYPTFYTFKLLKYFARGGDRIVRATSDHKLLSVYAARRADSTLALLVINKSPGATLKADCSIAGFQPASSAITYSYGIPQDEAALTGTGSPDIAKATLTRAAAEFPCKFPPYSATVIVLSPLRYQLRHQRLGARWCFPAHFKEATQGSVQSAPYDSRGVDNAAFRHRSGR